MKNIFAALCALLLPAAMCPQFAAAADGFFTVEKQEGRWWLIDPGGERFFSTGVNVVNPGGYYAPDLGYAPYNVNILDLYGDEETWADVTYDRLAQWNFNTLGAWSDYGLLADRMPYTTVLYLSPADWQNGTVADYFSDEFYSQVADKVASSVAPRVDDPNLIGWFLDNELRWGIDWRGVTDLYAEYFAMDAAMPGKAALVQFLRDRYGDDVGAFNAAWQMSLSDFDDLLPMTQIDPFTFDPVMRADREAFAGFVAEHYFSYCYDAIRDVDPNHLIMGCRLVSWTTPVAVAEAAGRHSDVVSVNNYVPWPIFQDAITWLADYVSITHATDMLAQFYELTQKPLLISEFSVRAMDSGLPNSWPPPYFFETMPTQTERADWFEDYARATFAGGYIVGYHWFAYMDEPPEGRFDGEDSNFGLVDNWDAPWDELVTRMTEVNADVYTWPIPGDDDVDDDVNDDADDDVNDDVDDDADDDVNDDLDDDTASPDDDINDDVDGDDDSAANPSSDSGDDDPSTSSGQADDDGACCG